MYRTGDTEDRFDVEDQPQARNFARRTYEKLLNTPFSETQLDIRCRDLMRGTEIFRYGHPAAYDAVMELVKDIYRGQITTCNELSTAAEIAAAQLSDIDGAFVEEAASDAIRDFITHAKRHGMMPEEIEPVYSH